jgi:SecY interacting protein Syd
MVAARSAEPESLAANGSAESSVTSALDVFVEHTLKTFPVLERWYDPEWPSLCEYGAPFPAGAGGEPRILWRPVRRKEPGHQELAPLERALGLSIHPDIKAYYGSYWSGGLEAEAPQGHVSLILLWNQEDAARLVENLIGHALAKRQAKTSFTVFFACTEPDAEEFLSIDNHTGQVLLEKPGHKPLRVVAENLSQFLQTLVPAKPEIEPSSNTGTSQLV